MRVAVKIKFGINEKNVSFSAEARPEIGAADGTADHERWQKMDFVVGIEIHLSGNHTCKGRDGKPHAFADICDQLQGKYPKDFKFTGDICIIHTTN